MINTPKVEEQKYQSYMSTRMSQRLITNKGIKINFSGYEFITNNDHIMEYLDDEINQGLPGIKKGKLLTTSERDPMQVLRRKHFAEFEKMKEDEKIAVARGIHKDMGSTKPQSERIKTITSSQVAN